MSDLFHEMVPDNYIVAVAQVMVAAKWHTYQVLTKRSERLRMGVPFFFKQWGGVRKAVAGRRLEGKTYDEFPRRVSHPVMGVEACVSVAREIEDLLHSREIFHWLPSFTKIVKKFAASCRYAELLNRWEFDGGVC